MLISLAFFLQFSVKYELFEYSNNYNFFMVLSFYFQITIFRSRSCHYWLTKLFSHIAISLTLGRSVLKDILLLKKCNTELIKSLNWLD